jgi:hypothetical protein
MQILRPVVAVIAIACVGPSVTPLDAQNAYTGYQATSARVSQLDWRLLHVNVAVACDKIEVEFDAAKHRFVGIGWVLTSDIAAFDVSTLRTSLAAKAGKLSAKLGQQFPEFKPRAQQDLEIEFRIGREGMDVMAAYRKGTIEFTEAFYAYLREIGRR